MTKAILLVLGLALTVGGPSEADTVLPWSNLSDLESDVTGAYPVSGCSDARSMVFFAVKHGADIYHLVVVSSDVRWAMIGPAGPRGEAPIWYGSVGAGGRLVIERELVGTAKTDVCPFLTRLNV